MPNDRHSQKSASLVLVASRIAVLRACWRTAARGSSGTAEAVDRTSLENALAYRQISLVLLDSLLPGLDGLSGIATAHWLQPHTRILLLADYPDDDEGIAAIRAGAWGYATRSIDRGLLGKAIDVILQGEIWFGRKLTSRLLDELASAADAEPARQASPSGLGDGLDGVTPREREVALLLSCGASNKEIAHKLAVSAQTVKGHLTAAYRKVGVSNRLQLAQLVLQRALPCADRDGTRRGIHAIRLPLRRKSLPAGQSVARSLQAAASGLLAVARAGAPTQAPT